MLHRIDLFAGISALCLHAAIAFALVHMPAPQPRTPTEIEVEMRRRAPPPPPPTIVTPLPPAPEPERKVIAKLKPVPPPTSPPPNREPPKEPPKEVRPVFGVTMESTTEGDSAMAVPLGNTTMIDPSHSGKRGDAVTPLPKAPAGNPRPEYKPVADIYVKTLPEIDGEACARTVTYPAEAEQLGIEGEVKLRVALDEGGKVHEIKLLRGLGHGLDQAAINALRFRCRFKPAYGTDGKPVAYVIQTYTWTFELPR